MYKKSIVASGHQLVSEVAAEVLKEGGNAFDAVVAAGFASSVVEPALTSMGGGGMLLGRSQKMGQELFFDFFADCPGSGRDTSNLKPDFFPVTVAFSGSSQVFNVGLGSVAVPGVLKGLVHVQERLGRMNLKDVLQPATALAKGHELNEQQAHFLQLLKPIMTMSEVGQMLYNPEGVYLKEKDILRNQICADFLEQLSYDRGDEFYRGEIAARLEEEMSVGNGLLTRQDMEQYRVHERKPLRIPYRDHVLVTSPEPSMGGTLICLSIALLAEQQKQDVPWGSGDYLRRITTVMQHVESFREQGVTTPERLKRFLAGDGLNGFHRSGVAFNRGTTHISIADKEGNCASMTCTNGEGSGYFAPGTGVMLNNMMGEDDLHPGGFHSGLPGTRVASMMSPSLLIKDGRVRLVIGSGGSKRIRTAISQVLSQVVDFGRDIESAVGAPRLFWDGEMVQVEPGFSEEAVSHLSSTVKINLWNSFDVYFGGVHAVVPGEKGSGDPRRGGAVVVV